MLKNFQYDLQLEEFARLCGRSLSAFKRDFKSAYQESPARWINDKRLDYARSLLVSTDMNVNDVCYESGFKNPSHFNRVFKDKFSLSPGQSRTVGVESEMQ
ncbi:AraC family transcriptional regulator [Chryseolinea sp. T2]|uniref:helix-turn-helix domain-containing protein n=1 Tax=Chryseolinea sp. T2 TaxID=3129255 RepID=UPI0030773579